MVKKVFSGKLFTVTQGFLKKEGRPSLHETVRHPGSCAVLPLLDSKMVLLIRQFRPSVGKTLWEIPAGTLEVGETPTACARRELEEETGYRCQTLLPIAQFYPSPGFCTEQMSLFLAKDLRPLSQKLEQDETIRVKSVSILQALRLIRQGKIQDAKTLIALFFLRSGLVKS